MFYIYISLELTTSSSTLQFQAPSSSSSTSSSSSSLSSSSFESLVQSTTSSLPKPANHIQYSHQYKLPFPLQQHIDDNNNNDYLTFQSYLAPTFALPKTTYPNYFFNSNGNMISTYMMVKAQRLVIYIYIYIVYVCRHV